MMLCMVEWSQQYGPSGKPRPVETAYQDELYRCFAEEVGPGAGIASERSCVGLQRRIDFHMVTPGWGFQLLCGTLQKSRTTGNISPVHLTRPTH